MSVLPSTSVYHEKAVTMVIMGTNAKSPPKKVKNSQLCAWHLSSARRSSRILAAISSSHASYLIIRMARMASESNETRRSRVFCSCSSMRLVNFPTTKAIGCMRRQRADR